jgi:uncharacterized protein
MSQGWLNLTYVHWQYDPQVVQSLLPSDFTIDTFEGRAWVGLIPFEMLNITFQPSAKRRIPTGRFGNFPETNVRTYIVDPSGRRGVWFFSLDINRIAPTLIARAGYGLPYCFADMNVETTTHPGAATTVRYASERRWPKSKARSHSHIAVAVGNRLPTTPESFDAFSSARWALGSRFLHRRLWANVNHPTWDLFDAELLECDETLVAASGLPRPSGSPIVRWSPGVEVKIERPHVIKHR